ncbi:sulfite exporter TauE/SafE family protein [Cohnella zeiphila]|uniref:Probable membrane transporter protein n=1 Tax=Cohnella zeiphila TaxID=2761120 RepID=A0A7X0VU35_9BACL|nr:sulfite exporter TauE/SafE family protein [Cohnella zeiphila]MBB6729832.1 sulfite exporter TauE/SafE family protein [Cohnella zeiphila]
MTIATTVLLLLLIGLLAGLSGSLVGLGGGFIVVPAMAFLFPDMTPAHLAGTSMAMLLFNSLSSTYVYASQRRIDYKAALSFAGASIPGSVIGAVLVRRIEGGAFFVSFGSFLLLVSLLILFRPKRPIPLPWQPTSSRRLIDLSGVAFEYRYHLPTGVAISFFVGFLSSLFGVGGGSLMVPTMTLLLSFPPHIAVATSMLQICLSAVVSTGSHAILQNIDWMKALLLAPGALAGGQLGARLAKRLPAKLLLRTLAIMLIAVSVRLILKA